MWSFLERELVKTKVVGLLTIALLLVGCSAISEGRITDKGHKDAYDIPVSYCVYYNNKGVCGAYGTRYDHYPERWWFDIEDGEKTGWVDVSEAMWNEYKIGEFYSPEGRR